MSIKKKIMLITTAIVIAVFGMYSVGLSQIHNVYDIEIDQFNESPILSQQVEEGELPPVEERLPKNPVVVEPHEEIGEYGGTLYTAWDYYATRFFEYYPPMMRRKLEYNEQVRERIDFDEFDPALIESWEVSDDLKEFTLNIREGLKWSDGHPVSTDDIKFAYESVLQHEDLEPVMPSYFRDASGKLGELEIVDEYTFKFTFTEPFGMFLYYFSGDTELLTYPKHYLKQFHADFTSKDKLNQKAEEKELEDWAMLFDQKIQAHLEPDIPTLAIWEVEEKITEANEIQLVRNPYYYAVDTEGNQLPYIDNVFWKYITELEMLTLETIAGEIDWIEETFRTPQYPTLKANEDKGNYTVIESINNKAGEFSLFFNLTTTDKVLREIFQDKRFRIAASHAINREEINQIQFYGLAEPRQVSFTKGSPFYSPEHEQLYTEYDPQKANELLDEMGLDERDDEGYRLRPDGERLSIIFEYATFREFDDAYELIQEYFKDIGIELILRPADTSLYLERTNQDDLEMCTWSVHWTLNWPRGLGPRRQFEAYANLWVDWLETDGDEGIKPPEDMIRLYEIIELTYAGRDFDKVMEIWEEAREIHKENFWFVGILGNDPRPAVAHNRLSNVPRDYTLTIGLEEQVVRLEQVFIEE